MSFVAIREEKTAATQAHNWYVTTSKEPTCDENGHIQAVCLGCGELKQETKDALGHTYVYASRNDATCTKDGTSFRTCQRCGDRAIVPDKGSAKGHKFSDEWYVVEESTCIKKGVKKQVCTVCGAGIFRDIEDFGPHRDKDGDRRCDLCREELSSLDPVVPGGDSSDRYDCDCNCHEGGIKGFFWKIGNFFCKLFRIKSKQVCDCGIYHF